ncbi:hypothetical protein NFC81_09095 [Salinispirillum sp. LH 10-3-1]|uniref:AbiTii domain-containing protein n=1 Tax=Salinispirillum sp. LH 10-3-1 TaxID=2952525 RepID=A0AB38YBZ9_9GAMM
MYLDDIVKDLLIDAGGAPRFVVKDRLLRALREFMRASDAWIHSVTDFAVQRGEAHYTIEPPEHTKVGRVMKVGKRMPVGTTGRKLPGYIQGPSSQAITLDPIPSQDEVVNLVMSLIPLRTLAELPDDLYDTWQDGIRSACLFDLYAMKDQPWSDPQLANYHMGVRDAEINRAQQVVVAGHSQGIIEVTIPRFG